MRYQLIYLLLLIGGTSMSQIPDSCRLNIGTNLAGITDYGTEIPFVNLMRHSRQWYTKSIGDPAAPFDSGFADSLSLRPDGYPTHAPQVVSGSPYQQKIVTIWAITDGWPPGQYTLLWEGTGTFSLWGGHQNLNYTSSHRAIFDFNNPVGNILELTIETSDISDPIHNIRLLMPGTESTYETQPFYSLWLDKLGDFKTIRFMDWGSTNGWGQTSEGGFGDSTLFDWGQRSQMDYYTWTHSKGIPYEMMVKLMNDHDKDGWVCIPHTASEDYIRKMASYFRDSLHVDRHLYVEYSNEIWNFLFPQAQWTNHYGCVVPGQPWPEGTVQYIQINLDLWTDEYAGQLNRISRIVGVFTGWLDIAQRVAFNVDPNTFDLISPTYYFGLTDSLELELDTLGSSATVQDVANFSRESMPYYFNMLQSIKHEVADSISKPIAFYEGGQHLTPNPFNITPTYEQAFLDIHRDTSMYNLYQEWFDMIRTLDSTEQMLLMNFSFVSHRNAAFGSWGVLESMDQDTSLIPAPKYAAILNNQSPCSIAIEDYDGDGIPDHIDIPNSTATTKGGILYHTEEEGILLKGRDGNCYLLIVDENGTFKTVQRPCP